VATVVARASLYCDRDVIAFASSILRKIMAFPYRLIAAALLPTIVMANQSAIEPNPADAKAVVSPPQYQSSFSSYRSVAEDETTPDSRWISANQEVSGGGHSMHGMHNMQPADNGHPALHAGGHQDVE
jgi:hypothetical protein